MIARCVYRRLLSMESLETRRMLAPIANGQALLDSFAVGGSREFEFRVDRGDFVRFAVGENDNGADAVLTISAPGGQTVSVNRGSGGVVAQFEAPASGEYQAIVTENGNNSDLAFAARFVALPGTPSLLAGRDAQLTSGQQLASSFGTGGFNLHPFQADAGDLVRVAVGEIDNGADSVLQVFSPGGDRIDIVAESGGSVLQFNAPLSGTYTALVSEDGNNSDLAYAIRFASFPGDSTLIAQRDATLGNGEVSATSFGVGGFNLHPFDADAGDTVRVAVGETDNGADSVLQVISPNGQRLAIESESGGSVIQFDAPVAGTYTALVSENGNNSDLAYQIRFVSLPGSPALLSQRDAFIENGIELQGSFSTGSFNLHPFAATQGDTVRVAVGEANNGADSFLQVFGPGGDLLAVQSASGGSIVQFDASTSGVYTAVVSESGSDSALTYTIRVATLPGTPVLLSLRDTVLVDGQAAQSSFGIGSFNLHRFFANANADVQITAQESDNGASIALSIIAPSGGVFASDSGSSTAELFFNPTESGTYTVIVSEVGNNSGLTYTVSASGVSASPPPQIGDYNNDTIINGDDYLFWRSNFGAASGPGLAADGNGDGVVNAADYTVWRDALAQAAAAGAGRSAAAPGAVGAGQPAEAPLTPGLPPSLPAAARIADGDGFAEAATARAAPPDGLLNFDALAFDAAGSEEAEAIDAAAVAGADDEATEAGLDAVFSMLGEAV